MSTQFTFLGMSVPLIAKINGLMLIVWGLVAYFLQTSENPSITAMIPAFFGFFLLLLGFLSLWNHKHKRLLTFDFVFDESPGFLCTARSLCPMLVCISFSKSSPSAAGLLLHEGNLFQHKILFFLRIHNLY